MLIARTVLTPGGEEATVAGTPVSLASSGYLVVGTGFLHQSSAILTIAGHTITSNPTSFEIADTAVKAGGPAVTSAGTSISMRVSGDLIIGGNAKTTSPPAAVFTVGAQRFTADGAGLIASGTTITAGGPAAVVAGTKVSLGSSGVLTVGDTATTLATLPRPSIFTVGGFTFTADPTGFSVVGAILVSGGPGIMINHTSISLNSSGSLLIGSNVILLQTPTPTSAVISTDGQVFTVELGGLVAVDGVTLSSGGPGTTISGISMSVGSGGVVVGSDTVRLSAIVGSAFTPGAPFTGSASESARISRWVLWGLIGVVVAL